MDGINVHYEIYRVVTNNATSNSSISNSNNSNSGGSYIGSSSNSNKRSSKNTTNTRNQLISVQQQQLLKNHLDCITDLKITELPYPMLISGDRDGIIKVFM